MDLWLWPWNKSPFSSPESTSNVGTENWSYIKFISTLMMQVLSLLNMPPPNKTFLLVCTWLFLNLKFLLEKHFQSMDEIKENAMRQLMVFSKEDFADCLEKWKGCWNKFGKSQRKYFEEDEDDTLPSSFLSLINGWLLPKHTT